MTTTITKIDSMGIKHTFTPRQERVKIDNTNDITETGLSVMHFNPEYNSWITRPVTVVYKMRNRNVIEIATAVCHSSDTFTKKLGTKTAIQNFKNGSTVMIPYIKGERPSDFIQSMFKG